MENKRPNHCISCTVTNCINHTGESNFCSLDRITVGTHEANPTVIQCTDCESFILDKKKCPSCDTKSE